MAGSNGKPTIVLVRGAFADASSRNRVVESLQQQGYDVVAPAVGRGSGTGLTDACRKADEPRRHEAVARLNQYEHSKIKRHFGWTYLLTDTTTGGNRYATLHNP